MAKKHLTLNIDSQIAEKAVADPNIQVSEITEKFLRALTASSKTEDVEKRYQGYQDLFKLMLPLLRKFKVDTVIAQEAEYEDSEPIGMDPNDEPIFEDPVLLDVRSTFLRPDGKLYHDLLGEIKIKDIDIEYFLKPQFITDEFLNSIQKGVNYRKEQFKEIEVAKRIIDALTKPIIFTPKITKRKGKKKK